MSLNRHYQIIGQPLVLCQQTGQLVRPRIGQEHRRQTWAYCAGCNRDFEAADGEINPVEASELRTEYARGKVIATKEAIAKLEEARKSKWAVIR